MNLSINNGTFRVVIAPPFPREIVSMAGRPLLSAWQDRKEFILFLDSMMPLWRESVVLAEELFDLKKDVWRDCTWRYRVVKEAE